MTLGPKEQGRGLCKQALLYLNDRRHQVRAPKFAVGGFPVTGALRNGHASLPSLHAVAGTSST